MQVKKRIKVRLNEKEKALLDRKVKQSGLSREAYIRQLIALACTLETQQPDYNVYTEQLHQIGVELNCVAMFFHFQNRLFQNRFQSSFAVTKV